MAAKVNTNIDDEEGFNKPEEHKFMTPNSGQFLLAIGNTYSTERHEGSRRKVSSTFS